MTGVGEREERAKDIPRASNLGDPMNSDPSTEMGSIEKELV